VRCLLIEVAALLYRSVDKRIAIEPPPPGTPLLVLGDSAQLHHAVLNLAINARDAMPEGGVLSFACGPADLDLVACTALGDVVPGRYVRVVVTDTGVGMNAEVKRHLFEPFFTTKPPGKGTGMGLAAVYGIVRGHKGAIAVRSEPGQGTTFEIFIPATDDSAAGPPEKRARVARGAGHLLVVDDESMVLRLMVTALRERGYQVTACQDGVEALSRFGEMWRGIDLVILDMVMPGMGGAATLAAMREVNPAVRVLLTSGFAPVPLAEEAGQTGVAGFLQKPFTVEELAERVGQALATST
jgi:two-component system, cell cycle sensor histidine kinase and response regulator CckA